MSIPGQYFCKSCLRPIPDLRNEGKCGNCISRELRAMRAGDYCDHCRTPSTQSLLYINVKTKKRYCVDCRAEFRQQLVLKGMDVEMATKLMISDFVLLNDPTKKRKPKRG